MRSSLLVNKIRKLVQLFSSLFFALYRPISFLWIFVGYFFFYFRYKCVCLSVQSVQKSLLYSNRFDWLRNLLELLASLKICSKNNIRISKKKKQKQNNKIYTQTSETTLMQFRWKFLPIYFSHGISKTIYLCVLKFVRIKTNVWSLDLQLFLLVRFGSVWFCLKF